MKTAKNKYEIDINYKVDYKNKQIPKGISLWGFLAGVARFELTNAAVKVLCLTA